MAKKQLNIRVSDLTSQQLDALMEKWGTSQTETISLLVQAAYIRDIENANSNKSHKGSNLQP